jgi:DsbC/DsbD-like thiol-disulfide interchange protein
LTARANPHADVSLLSETNQPRPGSTFLVGIRIVPAPGWHSYWSNPGDSGIAPTIQWKAPPGLRFGPLLHPAPTLLNVSGIISYVHAGEHILLVRVRADSTLKRGTSLPIQARLIWATCSESLCVPQRTTLGLNLRVGDAMQNSLAIGLRQAVQKLPHQLAEGVFRIRGGLIGMEVPKTAQVDLAQATFFPISNGIVAASSLRVHIARGKTEILGRAMDNAASRISGVLTDGKRSYTLSFRKAK